LLLNLVQPAAPINLRARGRKEARKINVTP
jgi:hypothetical protein